MIDKIDTHTQILAHFHVLLYFIYFENDHPQTFSQSNTYTHINIYPVLLNITHKPSNLSVSLSIICNPLATSGKTSFTESIIKLQEQNQTQISGHMDSKSNRVHMCCLPNFDIQITFHALLRALTFTRCFSEYSH